MRATTVLSFLLALVLAVLAVFAARSWLDAERREIIAATRQVVEEPEEINTIVVADKSFGFGERLTEDKLRTIEWAAETLPQGSFQTIDELVGETEEEARFALTAIEVGEPILKTKITYPGQRAKLSTALAAGKKAISIRVNDVLGVAGFVLPGDRVDVMLTRRSGESGTYVDVLLQGVKVLAIDQTTDERKDNPTVVRTVTFEVGTEEAQKLVLGQQIGTLSLALRNVASSDFEEIERVTVADLGGGELADTLEEELAKRNAEAEAQRLAGLEELLKSVSEGLTTRLDEVERSMTEQEPVIVEKEVVVEPPAPEPPSRAVVGVIRGGKRSDYSVSTDAVE